jgi:peptide/nickel transport system ATP-binding protein
VLEARGLHVALPDRGKKKKLFGAAPMTEILRDVDFAVRPGECVGVVGESGSGKSTLARALLRLLPASAGQVLLDGQDLTHLPERALRPLRARMQIVFQDSQSALNPRRRIGAAVAEPLLSYQRCGPRDAQAQAAALLERAGLPREFIDRYPHQLSGGQRQRVGIARAIGLEPSVVIADEIVSGLDVSVQAQILDLLRTLRDETGMGLVLISHNLSVVRMLCDRIVVMRRGSVVESGRTQDVFKAPAHAYTRGLLRAIPLPDVDPDWLGAVEAEEASA